ncbi:peptide chain release factor N(5)-glutamine methyltransferase [Pseudomonas viridiflava]|uniref:peptide chain release factor N(5)-glutamine methyltransferase n=1 Tax=Pseudomonas viridiflava TaxID=33069 RepID=UPI002EB383FF|nr:peptide chain release factor N(5)-glutamine methyltransferase [Pseudomonas viridiflava]MEE3931681.1 peptide chain release factor N(5)-glutamine methyltransferase [Pseudomonas viridiflava]MEE3942416.1 peptide chain release factor N(5)-glutamine methyltransferase [Pseudomonas viridiflava]MEE3968370.1 peptide chain release factor N(5)-glutamine methyltransferase [Pseudomonas viridiflava]MEE3982585.1 peptide chain release factor N(5)-glutamine methyltransferase [Pseudomonas viridiflava]
MTIIASLLRSAELPDSPTARLDAELLLAAALGKPRSFLHTWPERIVSTEAALAFSGYLQRRRTGEPVAYILGQQGFWKLDLEVAPHTLIPRPETEMLVEAALELVPAFAPVQVLDLGTGTGAIGLALANDRQQWKITAVDRVLEAVELAERNRQRLQLANAEVLSSHWFSALEGRQFDLIISNPPYIAETDPHLSMGDVRFEPGSALTSGPDGLDDLRTIISEAPAHLTPGGWLLLEHGYDQGPAVRELLIRHGFERIQTRRDLGEHERITFGCMPC